MCLCVCVCDFLVLETPAWGGHLCGFITKVIPLSFSLSILNLIFLVGVGVGVENSLTSSEVLSPSVREATPKTAEGDGKDGTSEPQ